MITNQGSGQDLTAGVLEVIDDLSMDGVGGGWGASAVFTPTGLNYGYRRVPKGIWQPSWNQPLEPSEGFGYRRARKGFSQPTGSPTLEPAAGFGH